MKKLFAVLLICTSVACGGGSSSTITGNSDNTPVASNPEPTPVASPTPNPVAPPTALYDVNFLADAGFSVKNNAGKTETFYAYTTSFDDQKTPTATIPANGQPAITKNGDTFSGSFGAQCVQLDLSIEGPGGRPFAFAYFDINGKEISNANRDQKISECRNRCTPKLTEVEEEAGDWLPNIPVEQDAVASTVEGCKDYRKVIVYSLNSCTQERKELRSYYKSRPVEAPSLEITGSPALDDTNPDPLGFTGPGTVAPAGGTFSPALPQTANRPAYGQDPKTLTTTYSVTKTYGVNGHCSVSASKPFSYTIQPTPPTCEQSNPNPGAVSASVTKTTTLHPGTPGSPAEYLYTQWLKMNQGGATDTARQNACANRGGTWLNDVDRSDIPGSQSDSLCPNGTCPNVCKVQTTTFPGVPGNDVTLLGEESVKTKDAVQATPDKYSVSVTLNYSIAAGAAQSKTFKIIYVPDNFTKKSLTVSVACGQAKSGSFTWQQGDQYNNSPNYSATDGHVTGSYAAGIQ